MKLHLKLFLILYATLGLFAILFIAYDIFTTSKINDDLKTTVDKLVSTVSTESQQAIENIAIESVKSKSQSAAKHVDLYMRHNPSKTLKELQTDPRFREIAIQPLQNIGYTLVFNITDMRIAIHKHHEFAGMPISKLQNQHTELFKILKEVSTNKSSEGRYIWKDPDGVIREKYTHVTALESKTKDGIKLVVAATAYLDDYTAPMKQINSQIRSTGEATKGKLGNTIVENLYKLFGAVVVCLLLLALIYVFIIRKITKPIYQLVEATEKMAQGDFRVKANYKGVDEIGQLANSFNEMAEALRERDLSLRNANEGLENRVELRTHELHQANLKIKEVNEGLEKRVRERTEDLVTANKALKSSEETFRALTESSDDTVMRFDQELRHIYVNPAVEKQSGIPSSEFWGKTHHELGFPEELVALWENGIVEVFKTGLQNRMEFQLPVSNVWVDWLLCPEFEEDGEVKAVIGLARDITEIKKTEEALRNSKKLLHTTLKSVADGVISTDTESVITFINPAAEHLTGYRSEYAQGKKLPDIFKLLHERSNEKVLDPVKEILDAGRPIDFEQDVIIVSKTGIERPIANSGSPIRGDKGELTGVVLVFRDITENRAREAQLRHQQKLESLGTLSGGVAHEINNPIGIIMNYGELILEESIDSGYDQIAEDAKEIVKESARIATIVKNLLSFSRHEQESRSKVKMNEIIEATLSLTSKIINNDQINFENNIQEDDTQIFCSRQQIMQVFMNLITNSRDALNSKYKGYNTNKKIIINTELLVEDGLKWHRTIFEDAGSGIPIDVQSRVFDPFFTTKGRDQGTGLGLSISYGIIKEHNGRMSLQSTPGEGTKFFVDLPLGE